MSQNSHDFNAANIGKRFKDACIQFDGLLARINADELTSIRKKLRSELKTYQEAGVLSVAFIGQYSAGKSTVISALTGRRDIKIDADIATDKTCGYDWNSIKLIDTPGLFTDRKDHDEITYEAISKADLVVFCLTYMLFDSVTVENFKKLAFEKGYRWKTMLLINKMSDEAGEEQQKIDSYRKSLADALLPYQLDEFPICFIDAKDYCDGVDEEDEFLLEVSRFQTFVDELNQFVKRRASLARFDTPTRIALDCVDEAQLYFVRDSNEDSAFLEILTQLSRRVNRERDRLRTQVKAVILTMTSAITKEGMTLANGVGNSQNFDELRQQVEINVRHYYEQAEETLQEVVEKAAELIQEEVSKILEGDLTQAFLTRLDSNQTVSVEDVANNPELKNLATQVNQLKKIAEKIGGYLVESATKSAPTGQVFLRSGQVAGSQLHHVVLGVGKFLRFKFQPWQAVGIAKNIGNVAKVAGPVLAIGAIVVDIVASQQENKVEQQMADARREITSKFQEIAKDLEVQVENQLREFETQLYGQIEEQINEARQKEEESIASSTDQARELINIRKALESIIVDINQNR